MAAGWGQRVGATIVDGLVLIVPNIILVAVLNGGFGARLVSLAVQVAYTTVMLSQRGQTVGNMAAGTRVVDVNTGRPPQVGKALGRSLAPVLLLVLLVVPAILDLFWPLWDRQNQTLHDKIAGTYVLRN